MHGTRCECHDCDAPIKRSQDEWDLFFYRTAQDVAELSKDPDRKVGAVILTPDRRQLSFGYNGFPSDVEDRPSLLDDKEFKLANMVHAEENALKQAPFDTKGCTLYVTRFPCYPCAGKVVAALVTRVVAPEPDFGHARWGASWEYARLLFESTGVQLKMMERQR